MNERSVVLVVLDGWGYSSVYEGNAIAQANTPNFDRLWKSYPHALLQASGEAVGLPWGEMGNSEVGHLNIGAGHIVPQDLPRISEAVANGSFYSNQELVAACRHVKETGGALHLLGLASTGGVHSHVKHLYALLEMAKHEGVAKVYIHMFTDGRDSAPKAALPQLEKLRVEIAKAGVGTIASVSGRYYAMDRDKRWDRVQLAYAAIAYGHGQTAESAEAAIQQAYDQGLTDEFIVPTVITEDGSPVAKFNEKDAAIDYNFRPDRERQLTEAFVKEGFNKVDGGKPVRLYFVTMTQYEENLPVHVAFPPQNVTDTLTKVLSDNKVRQFHIAETEKYPHATYFFNGGIEDPFPLEERLLIPSPSVATYDQQPEMSAAEITEELTKRIAGKEYRFIMANYANADMVGHSGHFEATVQAVQFVDTALGKLAEATDQAGSFLLITADHGNAEQMLDFTTGEVNKEHTTSVVPFIVVIPAAEMAGFQFDQAKLNFEKGGEPTGLLGDVAPTILKLLNIPPPEPMVGYGLL